MTVETDEAAPSPDIPKAKSQEFKSNLAPAEQTKMIEKRKSRFSFMMGK